ncbi:MAG: MFS transporter, partial [Nanoarchaeota archaeon]|nr:MFS transporter [Nanoarchaeota archaeon]
FSTKQIGILAATVFAVVLLSEISSGIFSDLYGRRNALVVSSSFFVIFLIFHLFFTSFPLLLLGSVFLGLGRSFYSGSFDALI